MLIKWALYFLNFKWMDYAIDRNYFTRVPGI